MNWTMVWRLIGKDWYLNRAAILASLGAGVVTLGVLATMPGSVIATILGVVVLATILIGMGAMVMMSATLERKLQTLPFAMSLPISYLEYTASKILGGVLIFLVLWSGLVGMVVGAILLTPGGEHGMVPFVVVMAVEMLMSTCLVAAVAIATESQGWTIGSTQVGVLGLNGIGWWIAGLPGIARTMHSKTVNWSPTATALVSSELGLIVLMFAVTFYVQMRKRDFV